jgi:hypothetical protein
VSDGLHEDVDVTNFLHDASTVSFPASGTLMPVVIAALEQAKRDLAALRLHDVEHGERAWTMTAGLPVYHRGSPTSRFPTCTSDERLSTCASID